MKNLIFIIVAILISNLTSCKDIVNSDPNRVEIIDSTSLSWKDYIEFKFDNDFISYYNNDSSEFFEIIRPSTFGKPFSITNNYHDSTIILNNVKLKDGSLFSLNHNYSFPLLLKPHNSGAECVFLLSFDSNKLPEGIYYDKVIINNDENIGFYVRVIVY
jgi:hypothetical protein